MTPLPTLADLFIKEFGQPIIETSSEIKFLCPKCNHKGLYANKSSGLFHCFHCGFRGKKEGQSENTPVRVINVPLQIEIIRMLTRECSIDKNHRKYLWNRGVYRPDRWGIVTIPTRIHQLLLSHFSQVQVEDAGLILQTSRGPLPTKFLEPRRILIPFWSGNHIVGAKTRANPFDPDVNPKYKYLAAPGAKIGSTLFYREEPQGDFLLTEGELKAIVAQENSFSAGATSGMAPSASSLSTISRIVNSRPVKRFFIVYDSSPTFWSDYGMIKSLYKLTNLCTSKACIVSLPLAPGQEKEDLDSFLVKNGPEELDNLLEEAWVLRTYSANRLRCAIESAGLIIHGNNQVRTRTASSNTSH